MKILFPNGEDGTELIRKLTGFVDADFEFEKIQTQIEMATDELVKVIGGPMYKFIYAANEDDSLDPEDEADSKILELIKRARICVAFRSIGLYAPLNDVSFTNEGRMLRTDEHVKSAFEWMLDRSNDSLEKIYYKSLDRLIEYLDETDPTIEVDVKWKDTDAYKKSFDILFRTTAEFGEFFEIESRYLLMKLAPGINQIKSSEITPRIGADRLSEILEKLKDSEPIGDDAVLLHVVKSACAYLSLSWALKRMSVTLFPSGVLQSYMPERMSTKAKKVPEKAELGVVALSFQRDGEAALLKIEELMKPVPEVNEDSSAVDLINFKLNCNQKFIDT